ncbi:MAG: HepT-like ribonuclease domain-containing protein, partial [Raoultibacter sp.]
MKQPDRDNEQLGIILRYCDRLAMSVERFGHTYEAFCADISYQDSASLCLIQIGEAVNRLSDEFKNHSKEIPWHKIYGMRCHLVHGYEAFDAEIAWDAIETHIPPLRIFCEKHYDFFGLDGEGRV